MALDGASLVHEFNSHLRGLIMVYDDNGPIYSMLNGKPCSTDFYSTNLRDPGCPCRCLWLVGYEATYVNNATSCPPGGYVNNGSLGEDNYYSCYVVADCNCSSPSFSAPGSIFTQLDPMIGACNGTYGMQCGVCIEGQCAYASIE